MSGVTSSPLFETLIAVVALWFATATLCSGIVEVIAAALGFRAKHLWGAVTTLLAPPAAGSPDIAIKSAAQLPKPLAAPATGTALEQFVQLLPGVTPSSIARVRTIEASAASQALVVLHAKDALANSQVGTLIAGLPASVRDVPTELEAWLERWFNGQMSSLSRSYRQRIRWWAAVVAAVVVVVLGIDSLGFAQRAYRSPTERAVIVAAAEQTASGAQTDTQCQQATFGERLACARTAADTVSGFDVSIWQVSERPSLFFVILGVLVSWGAVAAGAPFWFSILKRLMSLRPPPST